jgi:dynein assembly factor 1, axonemal
MRPKKAQMDKDEHGNAFLTKRYLRDLWDENEQYLTPKLNTCLYLHYKGFSKIEALDDYVNLAWLWLESNGIWQIENISHLEDLRTLYLHQNIISKIEGISTLTKLVTLNLSHNNIKVIENLGGCYSLKNLDLSHNMIVDYRDCKGLKDCPSLTSVDLQDNYIEYDEGILEFFFQFQNWLWFYFKGNPAIRKIKMYRKTFINGMK